MDIASRQHTVLMIATDFPPLAGTNVQRAQAFVAALPAHSWRPVIVTQAVEDLSLIDSRQSEGLPAELWVERVPSPDPFLWWRRHNHLAPVDVGSMGVDRADRTVLSREPHRQRRRSVITDLPAGAVKWLLRNFVYIPDAARPWAYAAARRAAALVRRADVNAIYTTCPSYSCHVAGLTIKRRTGLPWIADFTDLWAGRPGRISPTPWHAFNDRRLEARVVHRADRIIVTSPPWKDEFRRRYGEGVAAKVDCLTLGYERHKIVKPASPPPHRDVIHFVYTGAMYSSETPAPFLQALGALKSDAPQLLQRVKATFIGYGGEETPRLEAIIDQRGLRAHVTLMGPQPHDVCMQRQAEADVLLLLNAQHHRDTVRGKTFEYLASGKPILALTPAHGAQAHLLRPAGTAFIVEHGDVPATMAAVRRFLDGPAFDDCRPNWPYIEQFESSAITARLAAILSTAAGFAGENHAARVPIG